MVMNNRVMRPIASDEAAPAPPAPVAFSLWYMETLEPAYSWYN